MFHQLFHWHKADWRITLRNEDGSVQQIDCSKCGTCPKDALGYTCRHRRWQFPDKPLHIECGSWDDFERYEPGFDGPVVGPKPFNFKANE